MKMKRSKRAAAALAVGASVLGGGVVGAAFMVPSGAGAQDTTTSAPAGSTNPDAAAEAAPQWLTDALDQLVTDGTLNQTQRDAVEAALEAAKPDRGAEGHGGPGGRRGPGLDAAATALGMTQDELRTALQSGSTLAQLAESKNVDVQTVIDAIVADMNTHIDEHLASGDITQDQADARKADVTQRATDVVNGVRPSGPPMDGGRGHGGPQGQDTTTTTAE